MGDDASDSSVAKDIEPGLAKQLRSGADKARSEAGALLAKIKHSKLSPRTRRRQASQAVKAFWAGLTPQQRRNEMRRRRKIGMYRKKHRREEDG
jgi:hypothetical protein